MLHRQRSEVTQKPGATVTGLQSSSAATWEGGQEAAKEHDS